jgi:hypothetical protein
MALHKTTTSLLKESLTEFLDTANYCINFRKKNGGCLGFPGAAIMFSIVDSIGSYHEGKIEFTVPIDGQKKIINGTSDHFFILNSDFYGLNLEQRTIKKLYDNYRCLLLHNSALAKNHFLFMGKSNEAPFVVKGDEVHVNVTGFLESTKKAVDKFLTEINEIVPGSKQLGNIEKKR